MQSDLRQGGFAKLKVGNGENRRPALQRLQPVTNVGSTVAQFTSSPHLDLLNSQPKKPLWRAASNAHDLEPRGLIQVQSFRSIGGSPHIADAHAFPVGVAKPDGVELPRATIPCF